MACEGLSGKTAGEVGKVYELEPALTQRWFGNTGRYGRVGTIGEGSCFFHSVAYATNCDIGKALGEETRGTYADQPESVRRDFIKRWRREVFAEKLTSKKYEALGPTKKSYEVMKRDMGEVTSWADESVIRHVAKELNLNIIFMDMRRKEAFCGIHNRAVLYKPDNSDVPTVLVAWVNYEHFEPIVRITDTKRKKKRMLRTMFDSAKDAEMITHLMQSYKESCSL